MDSPEGAPLWKSLRRSSGSRREPMPSAEELRGGIVVGTIAATVAIAAIVLGSVFGDVHGVVRSGTHGETSGELQGIAWSSAAVVVVAGVVATRRFGTLLGHFVAVRTIRAAGVVVRLLTSVAGYVVVLLATFGLLDVSATKILTAGAFTGVVLGIAAQQSLGNVFAGMVLLLARPFTIGDHIRIRSGALGGIFDGVVLGMSLTYVTLSTEDGLLKIPNSGLLAAAVGPYRPKPAPVPDGPVTGQVPVTGSVVAIPEPGTDTRPPDAGSSPWRELAQRERRPQGEP